MHAHSTDSGRFSTESSAAFADAVATERLRILQEVLTQQTESFNKSCVGQVMEVLLERSGRHPGQLLGRSPYMQPVHVTAPSSLLNTIVSLRISAAYPLSMAGECVNSERVCA